MNNIMHQGIAALAMAAAVLTGCASPPDQALAMQPLLRISHSAEQTATSWHQLARYHRQRGEFDLARAADAASVAQGTAARKDAIARPIPAPAITPAPPGATVAVARMELVQLAPHVYQLKPILAAARGATTLAAASAKQPPAPTAVSAVKPRSRLLRVAIANGNGVPGMALQVRRLLARRGVVVDSLSNERPYRQQRTEIQYPSGREKEARALNQALKGCAVLVSLPQALTRPNLRLVLGKDAALAIVLRAEFGHALAAN